MNKTTIINSSSRWTLVNTFIIKCRRGYRNTNGEVLTVHTSIVVNCHLYRGTNILLSLSDYQYEEDYFWSGFLSLPFLSNSQYEQFSHSAPNINLHEKTQKVNLTKTTHSHISPPYSHGRMLHYLSNQKQ